MTKGYKTGWDSMGFQKRFTDKKHDSGMYRTLIGDRGLFLATGKQIQLGATQFIYETPSAYEVWSSHQRDKRYPKRNVVSLIVPSQPPDAGYEAL
jgi:hypothetical protein